MPQYFDYEIPVAIRRAAKDLKCYHHRYGSCGPPLISKYVYVPESHNTIMRYIGANGELRPLEKMDIPLPLKKNDPFGLQRFNQLYSVNKRKRWQIIEMARHDIAALQDPSCRLRVTIIRIPLYGLQFPESRSRSADRWLSEYHTVDQRTGIISKKTRRTLFPAIMKPENPPRRRKGRLIRPLVQTPIEMPVPVEQQNEIPLWERHAHIIYEEQYAYIPKRMMNVTNKFTVRRSSWRRKGDKKYKYFTNKQLFADTSLSGEKVKRVESSDQEEIFSCHRKPFCATLQELLCIRGKKMKKQISRAHSRDIQYEKWLSASPASDIDIKVATSEDDSVDEVVEDILESDVIPLKSFLLSLQPETNIEIFAASIGARRIERLYPTFFIVDSYRKLDSHFDDILPEGFRGVLIIQSHKLDLIRCIINDLPEANTPTSSSHQKVVHNYKYKLSAMEYAPSSVFIGAQSLWERDAEHFAFDELVDNLPSTSGVSSSIEQSERQICDICCCEKSCIALSCGHFFCEECWIRHAVICLKHNHIPIKCPAYNCDSFLELEHMMVFMPLSECDRYSMLLGKKHLMGPQWIRCIKCPRVLHLGDKEQQSRTVVSLARCACGTAMCAHCGGIGHAPMTCNAAAEYGKILRMNGQTLINVNDNMTILVKKCPGCGSFCQRASGCNQMHCSCDTNFCYMCGSRWTPSHYNCTNNVDVRVHLIDVPKAASHHFSTKVFNRCAIFRYARSLPYMLTLKKDLRKLPLTFIEYEHAIDVFKAVSEVLEILEVHMYYLRRCNRTKRDHIYNALRVHIGSLKHFSSRLTFLCNMFVRICRNNKKTSVKVGDIIFKIEHILRLLMLEAL